MTEAGKRPCAICRCWFRPDARVGDRQHACGKPECQTKRRQKTQASWRHRNPGYAIAYRIDQRGAQTQPPPEAMRLPSPLNQLPCRSAKDQFRAYLIDPARVSGTLPPPPQKTSPGLGHTEPAGDDATGVSPTRPAMGTSASAPTASAAAVDGVAG